MKIKVLPIFFGVVFALTLYFAVAAGAQEDAGSPGGGGQVLQVQSQQVQTGQVGTMAVETQAQGCQGQKREFDVRNKSNDTDRDFHIEGDKFRVVYDVDFTNVGNTQNSFILEISNGSRFFKSSSSSDNHEEFVIDKGPGDFTLEARLRPQGNGTYSVTVYDCKNAESSNDNNNGGGGGGGNNNRNNTTDTTDTIGVSPSQTDTTATTTPVTGDTTTADTNSLDSLADTTTADNANRDADAFRCDFFLRAVRDDRGALRAQYRGDDLVVQRFEQCLSEDVLANTIPDRKLPFTGGPVLPFAGGLLLLVASALFVVRIIRR